MSDFIPVVITALANDEQASLKLGEEFRAINSVMWTNLEDPSKGKAAHLSLPYAQIDDLYDYVHKTRDNLVVFHFAGHSDGEGIHAEDQYVLADSLSTLLGTAPNLKLVFLNGCANQKQVERLQKEGIPVIIATSVKVMDEQAIKMAENFYQALTTGISIKKSFELAKGYLDNFTAADGRPNTGTSSGWIDFSGTSVSAWGIFYKTEAEVEVSMFTSEKPASNSAPIINPMNATLVANPIPSASPLSATLVANSNAPITQVTLTSSDPSVVTKHFPLRQNEEIIIGRNPALCQIEVRNPYVSGVHGLVKWQGDKVIVIDKGSNNQGSTNGTFWNNQRIAKSEITETGSLRLYNVTLTLTITR